MDDKEKYHGITFEPYDPLLDDFLSLPDFQQNMILNEISPLEEVSPSNILLATDSDFFTPINSPALPPSGLTPLVSGFSINTSNMPPLDISTPLEANVESWTPASIMEGKRSRENQENLPMETEQERDESKVRNRRNYLGPEIRRSNHKMAEQRRRDAIKTCFQDIRDLLPNITEKVT